MLPGHLEELFLDVCCTGRFLDACRYDPLSPLMLFPLVSFSPSLTQPVLSKTGLINEIYHSDRRAPVDAGGDGGGKVQLVR